VIQAVLHYFHAAEFLSSNNWSSNMSNPISKLAAYGQALKAFDWQYQFADDHSRYLAGEGALRKLHKMQRQIDPDGVVWMNTPGARGHGAPQPQIQRMAA
jgi:hypothetical protein